MTEYELKLASRRVVKWAGVSGEDAARRYVDCVPTATVVAWREANRHGLHIGMPQRIVIGNSNRSA